MVVDSNILLLLIVGPWNPRAIETHKRLSRFSVADFELLRTFLGFAQRVVTTAHILTEVSNLAGAATGQRRDAIMLQMKLVIGTLEECTLSLREISSQPEFRPFGLSDAALIMLCSEMLLTTEEGRLANHLQRKVSGPGRWTI